MNAYVLKVTTRGSDLYNPRPRTVQRIQVADSARGAEVLEASAVNAAGRELISVEAVYDLDPAKPILPDLLPGGITRWGNEYQRGYTDGFDAPANVALRRAAEEVVSRYGASYYSMSPLIARLKAAPR